MSIKKHTTWLCSDLSWSHFIEMCVGAMFGAAIVTLVIEYLIYTWYFTWGPGRGRELTTRPIAQNTKLFEERSTSTSAFIAKPQIKIESTSKVPLKVGTGSRLASAISSSRSPSTTKSSSIKINR